MARFKYITPSHYPQLPESWHDEVIFTKFKNKVLYRMMLDDDNPQGIVKPNGLMIYGPPHNGKLNLALQMAHMAGFPYIMVRRHDILDREQNSTCDGLMSLFESAREMSPVVIIIENVETIIPSREMIRNSGAYVDVMANLSLLKECGRNHIYVFATTSRPNDVDSQIGTYGYLDELFFTPYPDCKKRAEIIEKMTACVASIDSSVLESVVEKTEDYTIGDLRALMNEVKLEAALTGQPIDGNLMKRVFENFRTPLSGMFRAKLEQVHRVLESNAKAQQRLNIGFR